MEISEISKINEINENNSSDKEDSSSRVYELGYLLVPTITPSDVPINYGNIKELISSLRGEIITDEMPRNINLAYPMQKTISNSRHKFNTAYFGWIKFVMEGEQVIELKKRLDLDPNLVRFLILKTVKENTIAAKRFVRGDSYKRPTMKKHTDNEVAVPINKEEIDKEIDALIAA